MFNFGAIIDQTTQLFHSADISELMSGEAPLDPQELLAQTGFSTEELTQLTPDEIVTVLQEKGIDAAGLDAQSITDTISGLVTR